MTEPTLKQLFVKYVSLNVTGMIGLSCYILADTFFVAQGVGENGLAALNLAIPVYSFVHGTGLMIGMGGATRYTLSRSNKVFTQALYFALIASGLFVALGLFFSGEIALLLGADTDTFENAGIYLKTILCFSPMFLLNNVMICFVRNDGNPKLSMTAMLSGSFSNVILDYLLIFPLNMGMFGAAFATGIAPVISLAILSVHFLKKKNTFHLQKQAPRPKSFADMVFLGVSALITEVSSGVVIVVFNGIILKLEGNTGVAAYGVIANIALIVIAVFTGISQGMQPLISLCFRDQKPQAIKKVVGYGFVTAFVLSLLVYLVSFVFAEPMVGAFNRDGNPRLTEISVAGLRIYFTAFLFAGFNLLSATYFSAIDNPKNAFSISFLRGFGLIVPAAYVLSSLFGMNGVWIAMPFTECVVLLVSANLMRRTFASQ